MNENCKHLIFMWFLHVTFCKIYTQDWEDIHNCLTNNFTCELFTLNSIQFIPIQLFSLQLPTKLNIQIESHFWSIDMVESGWNIFSHIPNMLYVMTQKILTHYIDDDDDIERWVQKTLFSIWLIYMTLWPLIVIEALLLIVFCLLHKKMVNI